MSNPEYASDPGRVTNGEPASKNSITKPGFRLVDWLHITINALFVLLGASIAIWMVIYRRLVPMICPRVVTTDGTSCWWH